MPSLALLHTVVTLLQHCCKPDYNLVAIAIAGAGELNIRVHISVRGIINCHALAT